MIRGGRRAAPGAALRLARKAVFGLAAGLLAACGLLLPAGGCAGAGDPVDQVPVVPIRWSPDVPPTPLDGARPALLARAPAAVAGLEIPQTSRPAPVPDAAPLRPSVGVGGDVTAPFPAQIDHHQRTGANRPAGASLRRADGQELPWLKGKARGGAGAGWRLRKGEIELKGRGAKALVDAGLELVFPLARDEERSRNLGEAGGEPLDLILAERRTPDDRRRGALIPAPGHVEWRVRPVEGTALHTRARLLPPAFGDGASDGAVARVEVVVDGAPQRLAEVQLRADGDPQPLRVDLSPWAGQEVGLRLASDPGADSAFDYVFFEEPALRDDRVAPRRLLVLFIDTLRADRLGAWGHTRPTSPHIDALAASGARFHRAWSPAPWTLPSARAALSGRLPHRWDAAAHLGRLLAAQGWTTAALAANMWLSDGSDISEGWSLFRGNYKRTADHQLARARQLVAEAEGRDLALLVHILEPHLPYNDHDEVRGRFAGPPPAGLPADVDEDQLNAAFAAADPEERAAIAAWASDRYDEQIAWMDARVGALLELVGPEATVVLFSDHGEEFWEDRGPGAGPRGHLGHGYALNEMTLRVPLIVRSPGLPPQVVESPVDLTDLLPTTLGLLGGPVPAGLDGRDLSAALRAGAAPPARPQAQGWTFFSDEQWGLLQDGRRWIAGGGAEVVVAEGDGATPLPVDPAPFHAAFEAATGWPVRPALRVRGPGGGASFGAEGDAVRVRLPGGIAGAWARFDWRAQLADPALSGDAVELRAGPGQRLPRELWVMPAAGLEGGELEVLLGERSAERAALTPGAPVPGAAVGAIRGVEVAWAVTAVRPQGEVAPDDVDLEALEALGYVDR